MPSKWMSGLSGDLKHPGWMYLKAVLFLIAGVATTAAIFAQIPTLQNAFLLAIGIWSFCRLYYFCFYVIEKYIDPSFRFAGLWSVVVYFTKRKPRG
ncbi:hypothetical protein CCAX7_46010 [Capsulimonas corticalis]|uniref:Uncharacterized protein n=1 Tax=Capsulimonas corticalis TaxID=2219043 RepID=A0A402D5C8_9BACT|nr:hypothetical protein [Capsulimonas corticalis]BDI32550.1 hypothetical protein CCAX7_46010 [Capsulimonas corticalis]